MELAELRTERARAVESRTVMGHLKNAMGYGMSLYCVYRYPCIYWKYCIVQVSRGMSEPVLCVLHWCVLYIRVS